MLPDNIVITDYPGTDLLRLFKKEQPSKVALLVDENTLKLCYPIIQDSLPEHIIIQTKSGEANKNINTCQHIWTELTQNQFDRDAMLIVLGGGLLCDMGGFCAATYKRGIRFVFLPTTLLAQCDASIGGKLGIDFLNYKNQIGLFQEPDLNIIFPGFIKTLPERELKAGFAEIIKHCLISDKQTWEELRSKPFNKIDWPEMVKHSAELKTGVVDNDRKEKGLRKVLNFGHTIGHAIESYCLQKGVDLLHGEAVAAGIWTESFLSAKKNLLSENRAGQIQAYIDNIYPRIALEKLEIEKVCAYLLQDKKNKEGKIKAAIITDIGNVRWDFEITQAEVADALEAYRHQV
ncbi:MAG TPA: 3-dehydroquinate synthase [Cyclobacteriaceae bacterium]|nr:3-dehydroquinate synthase [Cyclobacteriaceae bacterium]